MDTSKLNFYYVMGAINDGLKSVDEICEEYNYPATGSDEFNLLLSTFNILKKKEAAGDLIRYEPSLNTETFTLAHYIKQKIWWHSGPDALFALEAEVKRLSDLLNTTQQEQEQKFAEWNNSVAEFNSSAIKLKDIYNTKLNEVKEATTSLIVSTFIGFAAAGMAAVYLFLTK